MATTRLCNGCLKPIPADAPQGLCPECLVKGGLASESSPKTTAAPTPPGGRFVPPAPDELTAVFPQLEIMELLGQGGMGMVYKARQPHLDRLIGLKILPPEFGRDPAFAERFAREARALARLNHPNIVSVYDFGRAGDYYYFIMEFVDGLNLRQLEQSRRLTPKEALTIIPKICDALQYAHDEGIVHRDIKPGNILLDKKGRVKIADFGLAKLISPGASDPALTQSQHVMGTPHYMAPEQIEHPLDVDHRADIYSLGVVLYEMLTGELPIGRFASPSEKVAVDVRLDEVVLRTLEKEPQRRYQKVSEIKTNIESIIGLVDQLPMAVRLAIGFEYKSQKTLWGMPLLHIAYGMDPATGKKRTARGIVAMGQTARGVIAMGGVARGIFAFGGVAIGCLAVGGISLGLISFGGLALGLLVGWGGLAVGPVALGGLAFGYMVMGGFVGGVHAVGGNAADPVAHHFFKNWDWLTMNLISFALVGASTLIGSLTPLYYRRKLERQERTIR